jgi:hypothetical protein
MSQYVITIVPVEDGSDEITGPVAQTVVRIETGDGHPVVRELTVRAPESAGLTGELPYVDFDILLRAFVPPPGRGRGMAAVSAAVGAAPTKEATRAEPPRAAPKPTPRPAERSSDRARISRLAAARAYRRAPDYSELEAVYERVGSISGVAEHFDVPVHTAQGWISRMRRRNSELSAT